MVIRCRQCQAAIPAENINRSHSLVRCPACQAIFPVPLQTTEAESEIEYSLVPMPRGFTVDQFGDELNISKRALTHPYVSFVTLWLIVAVVIFSSCFVVPLVYLVLARFFNTTQIRVDRRWLQIEHGPIPMPHLSRKQVEVSRIQQLYCVENRPYRQKNRMVSYEVWMVTTEGKHENLLTGLTEPQQALYLEQQIEQFLGIANTPVYQELGAKSRQLTTPGWNSWRNVARQHGLNISADAPEHGYRMTGDYRGHELNLDTISYVGSETPSTRLTVTTNPGKNTSLYDHSQLTAENWQHLLAPTGSDLNFKGKIQFDSKNHKLTYTQPDIETDEAYLQFLMDALVDLTEAFPQIITLGGEIVPTLEKIAVKKDHHLQAVAVPLLSAVSKSTIRRWQRPTGLVCPRCLVRCAAHQVNLSWLDSITYYGCRACRQSRRFLKFEGRIVAMLDNRMTIERRLRNQTLLVNWFNRAGLFDFDEVAIIRATDEEVERFVIQVGNDTDPVRQAQYKQMSCVVSTACELSPNTWRILQRTFGQVERRKLARLQVSARTARRQNPDSIETEHHYRQSKEGEL